ncbi:MAG TPA: hypothetical protein VHD38_00150, partial [Candidatus Paceibacterota bacterium]|nr:hypothetical protein [Candidatus Paceibacterota bacterium]
MDSLARWLEQVFSTLTHYQNNLSEHWRRHSNRRTTIVLIVAGSLLLYAWLGILRPPENFPINELVSVPQGETLSQVAYTLKENGVIRSPFAFRVLM